jgi:hypothetical protein
VPETIDINSLKPNTSEITTGQVMELLPQKSIFPYGKRVIARTYNSSVLMNGVQGVAGSNRVGVLSPMPLAALAAFGQIPFARSGGCWKVVSPWDGCKNGAECPRRSS